ncbi:MAG: 4-(cytidine 5'-diphospho)-2-C-methyl-D-erythritol kinase [Planctomycetota bacterium]
MYRSAPTAGGATVDNRGTQRREADDWLSLSAPAKVNLYLEVLGSRGDGYHEVETVMAPLRLADHLSLRAVAGDPNIRLQVAGPLSAGVPTDERNLVVQAVTALQQRLGVEQGAEMALQKHVPHEAGLGGGSSDAAAALILADAAWGTQCDPAELDDIASSIGSDVPFFLNGGPAVCRGRGEQVAPLATPAGCPIVVAKPAAGLSTKRVFSELKKQTGASAKRSAGELVESFSSGDWRGLSGQLFNRLEETALGLAEPLRQAAATLREACGCSWTITGSGSALFAVAPSDRAARRLASVVRQRGMGWAVATSLT